MDLNKLGEQLQATEKAIAQAIHELIQTSAMLENTNDEFYKQMHDDTRAMFRQLRKCRIKADKMTGNVAGSIMELEWIMRHSAGHPGDR